MILITDPELLEGEEELLIACFEHGLENLHLRKYQATEQELTDLLKRIPEEYHSRILLHHHHYLVRSFQIKGVHFNSYVTDISHFQEENLVFSRSAHRLEDLEKVEPSIDRVLLSPVFPTISKESRRAPFSLEAIGRWVQEHEHSFKLTALGGVAPDRIGDLARTGFDAFAVLGGVWKTFREEGREKAIEAFKLYQKRAEEWEART